MEKLNFFSNLQEENTRVIWAYGDRDIGNRPRGSDYHNDNRGTVTLALP